MIPRSTGPRAIKATSMCAPLLAAAALTMAEVAHASAGAVHDDPVLRDAPVWQAGNFTRCTVFANHSIKFTHGEHTFAWSSTTVVYAGQQWLVFDAADAQASTLLPRSAQAIDGNHETLGAWRGFQTVWRAAGVAEDVLVTTVKHYTDAPDDLYIFEHNFPQGLQGTAIVSPPVGVTSHLISQWPAFTTASLAELNMTIDTWQDAYSYPAHQPETLSNIHGPLMMSHDPDLFVENCTGLVLSTADNFKSGLWAYAPPTRTY